MTLNSTSVLQLLHSRAAFDPQQTALLEPGRRPASNADVIRQVMVIGQFLRDAGVSPTDRVALAVPNGSDLATAVLGTVATAVCAPLAPEQPLAALEKQLTSLGTRLLIVQRGFNTAAPDAAIALRIPVLDFAPDDVAGRFTLDVLSGASHVGLSGSDPSGAALLLSTSGTTSAPKLVPLTEERLLRSAANVATTLELGPSDRGLNVMPLFHIHGIVAGLLAPLSAGGSVVCTPGFAASEVLRWIEEHEPTWYTAVPTIHQAMLDVARRRENRTLPSWPTLRFIRSSSAALPARLMTELEQTFSVPVIEAYGMTEAAHQMTSNPLPPGVRKPGTVGRAVGLEVAVLDDNARVVAPGTEGHIAIQGATVTTGYLDNPVANASDFVDGWFLTGDRGRFDEDGYLTITGRLKEIINRGGEKVAPREVDDVLLQHPDVVHAVAFALPHPRLGEEVGAAVVLRESAEATAAEVRVFASERLAPYKVPRRVVVVDEIPRGPSGKLIRTHLADALGLTRQSTTGPPRHLEPLDDLERELQGIWQRVLGLDEPPSTDAEFFELGGDSLHATDLLLEVEAAFAHRLPASVFLHDATVCSMATHVRDPGADADFVTVVRVQPGGSKPPLFCLLRAGSIVATRHFASGLGPDQPVYGLWVPLMHGPREAAGSIEEIAAAVVEAVRSVQPNGPYFLFGYSLGAFVMYEAAAMLAENGERIGLVVLADALHPRFTAAQWRRARARRRSVRRRARKLFSRRGPEAITRRVRRLLRLSPPPRRVRLLPGADVVADWAAVIDRERKYVPRSARGPVAILATRSYIAAARSPDLGWADLLTAGWSAQEVPGSHESMIGEPHVHVLIARLGELLDAARAPISS